MNKIGSLAITTNNQISQLIFDLGEIYHEAAIISYLFGMESIDYREGLDEPKELKAHLSALTESVQKTQEAVLSLANEYSEYNHRVDVSNVVHALVNILGLIKSIKSHIDVEKLLLPENQLMAYVEKLRETLQDLVVRIGETINKTLPFAFYTAQFNQHDYDNLRQNPQSVIQSAFTLFESHLRTRLDANAELFGEALINNAYGSNGRLIYGATPAEKIGTRNLMSGAYATFRNPRMHRIINDNEQTAIAVIALVDLLIQIVDSSQDNNET